MLQQIATNPKHQEPDVRSANNGRGMEDGKLQLSSGLRAAQTTSLGEL